MKDFTRLENAVPLPLSEIADLPLTRFRVRLAEGAASGNYSLAALFALPADSLLRFYAVVRRFGTSELWTAQCLVDRERYPSLSAACPQANWFERAIAEEFGVVPVGHPRLAPLRFPDGAVAPELSNPFVVEGESIHEVAVGPVHAGVIEPGHFRFQCFGEIVHNLEISLGYQHRGVERLLVGHPGLKFIHYLETLAGDTTIGHATAGMRLREGLSGAEVPARARAIRALHLELERIANHVGDLGALAGDVAFLPGASYCGRIRGEYLNLTAALCGNRFGRNQVRHGGIAFDPDGALLRDIAGRLARLRIETADAFADIFDTPGVLDRFESTGTVPREAAREIGMVGLAARAGGIDVDIRRDFNDFPPERVVVENGGDVLARALVRRRETFASLDLVEKIIREMPSGAVATSDAPVKLRANALTVSFVEGWRGEICHVATTGDDGGFSAYKVFDPSFHNWFGLALALREGGISDFPICNKSFNLSYCGTDL